MGTQAEMKKEEKVKTKIQKVGVIGAGTMGNGIAQVMAQTGLSVHLNDLEMSRVETAMQRIETSLGKLHEKGKIEEGPKEVIGRITPSADLKDLKGCDLVVEAVFEKREIKEDLLEKLYPEVPETTILASNTSSISITKLGSCVSFPQRFIGMHFMNPVPLMPLVEVIRGLETSDETTAAVLELTESLGKTAVEVNDSPGFVSNRVLLPMINEAVFARMEGVGTVEAIDTIMKLGMNHPMGPLQLADFIGLDVCLDILEVLHRELGDPKYRPCPLLRRMVDAGHLGKKSGRGFYNYEKA